MTSIGNLSFKTKKAAEDYTREIITKLGCCKINKNHFAWKFFVNLINNHPCAIDKIGCGIKCFIISQNKLNKNAMAVDIERIDRSTIDFSWINCARGGKKTTILDNLKSAMRQFISNDITKFKNASKLKCNYCKTETAKSYHVDHDKPSFVELSNNFIGLNPTYPKIFDDEPGINRARFRKIDHEYAKKWSAYHKEKSILQILCDKCNLKKSKT